MAKLTLADAARVAGVARSTLYRAIQKGRLSADPDGRLDTAELLRAGYTLQRSAQQTKDGALHDAPPRNIDAQRSSAPAETQALHAMQQERDMLRLERDMLRQQLEAAQMREQAAFEREREAREERQAAREREALLLRMVEQAQQRYDRLLDMPRSTTPRRPESNPRSTPHPRPEPSPHQEPHTAVPLTPGSPPVVHSKQAKAAVVARLRAMRAQGLSLAQIAAQMQAEGVPTLSGKGSWQKGTVAKLLRQ
jgi:hypothetical protein